jgi:hypothetical protein
VLEIEPGDADQVTDVFEVLITSALNCMAPADSTEAVPGETVTATPGGLFDEEDEFPVETPEQAASRRRADTKVSRVAPRDKSARCERQLFPAGGSA